MVGIAGTGGAFCGCDNLTLLFRVLIERAGEGERNVRSLMELWLSRLARPGWPGPPLPPFALFRDVTDPRRRVRFVCMFPTGSGEDVRERNAAAAAAEESDVLDLLVFMNAWLAARVADVVVLRLIG